MKPVSDAGSAAAPDRTTAPGWASPVSAVPDRVGWAMVCTANRCRSALAEHIVRRRAAERGVRLTVTSMGFLPAGQASPRLAVEIAAQHGIDLSQHRSRVIDPEVLNRAGLILTMTQAQAREVVARQPALWPRTFALKRFAAFVADQTIPRRADFDEWLAEAGSDRRRSELFGDGVETDIADPMNAPPRVWHDVVDEIERHVSRIIEECQPLLGRVDEEHR